MIIDIEQGSTAPDISTHYDDQGQIYVDEMADPAAFGFFGVGDDLALVVRRIDGVVVGLDGRLPRCTFVDYESPTDDAPSGKGVLITEDWPQPGEWRRIAELPATLTRDSTILFLGTCANIEWARISKNLYADVSPSNFALALRLRSTSNTVERRQQRKFGRRHISWGA
jgi:hypothetical protein